MDNVPVPRNRIATAQKRLELRWCSWPGDWDSFIEVIRKDDIKSEIRVIEQWPAEFRMAALERAERIERWQENRLMTYLTQMDDLTRAEKTCMKSGDQVPDNATRLKANSFLIERAMGAIKSGGPPGTPDTKTGAAARSLLERREKLREMLKDRDVTDVEVEYEEPSNGQDPLPDGDDPVVPTEG